MRIAALVPSDAAATADVTVNAEVVPSVCVTFAVFAFKMFTLADPASSLKIIVFAVFALVP